MQLSLHSYHINKPSNICSNKQLQFVDDVVQSVYHSDQVNVELLGRSMFRNNSGLLISAVFCYLVANIFVALMEMIRL